MAALVSKFPTLIDIARTSDPDGKIAEVAEILTELMPIMDDIPYVQANNGGSHKSTLRASLPAPTWRLFNKGVVQTKATNKQITDSCGMLEAYSEVDKDLADLNGNTAAYRTQEDTAHIEGMGQEMASTIFYGDTDTDPEKFVGLSPRYYTLSGAVTSGNVIDGGGTGSVNSSIWLVGWGPATVHGIYPNGSQAGLKFEDKGQETVKDADGALYEAYRSHYKWDKGLVVRDWRAVVRICNIDITKLNSAGDTTDLSANIIKLMIKALHKLPASANMKPVFYANEDVIAMLDVKLDDKRGGTITMKDLTGAGGIPRPDTLMFRGYPVRRMSNEILLSTESALT